MNKTAIALPQELPERFQDSDLICRAYQKILHLEESANAQSNDTQMTYARILGYLILDSPSDRARDAVAQDVDACKDDRGLEEQGKLYLDHLIRPLKHSRGRLSSLSSSLSRSSCGTAKSSADISCSPRKARQNVSVYPHWAMSGATSSLAPFLKALLRDGFRCLITGDYDMTWMESRPVKEAKDLLGDSGLAYTEATHIMPETMNMSISQGDSIAKGSAPTWDILKRLGYESISTELNGRNIHRLENLLTLELTAHQLFDDLRLWFEPTDQPNTYKVKSSYSAFLFPYFRKTVNMTSSNADLPPPSPQYLALHATCAKVANSSGAGLYIDRMQAELEDAAFLSEDGTSAELLDFALRCPERK